MSSLLSQPAGLLVALSSACPQHLRLVGNKLALLVFSTVLIVLEIINMRGLGKSPSSNER